MEPLTSKDGDDFVKHTILKFWKLRPEFEIQQTRVELKMGLKPIERGEGEGSGGALLKRIITF